MKKRRVLLKPLTHYLDVMESIEKIGIDNDWDYAIESFRYKGYYGALIQFCENGNGVMLLDDGVKTLEVNVGNFLGNNRISFLNENEQEVPQELLAQIVELFNIIDSHREEVEME